MYFRGCPENIFYVRTDSTLVLTCLLIILVEILVMYLQAILGSRFFFPFRMKVPEHKFFYNKEELLNYKKDLEYVK